MNTVIENEEEEEEEEEEQADRLGFLLQVRTLRFHVSFKLFENK